MNEWPICKIAYYLQMPIGMLGIYRLLFLCFCVFSLSAGFLVMDISVVGWRSRRVMKFCRMVDLGGYQVISLFGEIWPQGSAPRPKSEKSIIRWTVVWQTGWTAVDRVWCEKHAAACSVTASVVNYLYFAVIGLGGYTPVWIAGVLVLVCNGKQENPL